MHYKIMRADREFVSQSGIIPKLRLGIKTNKGVRSLGPKRVKLIAVKLVTEKDSKTGKDVDYVRYLFEENGENKKYQTKKLNANGEPSYLVQRLSEINDNEEVILEMKKAGIKNYIEVIPVSGSNVAEVEQTDIDELDGDGIIE